MKANIKHIGVIWSRNHKKKSGSTLQQAPDTIQRYTSTCHYCECSWFSPDFKLQEKFVAAAQEQSTSTHKHAAWWTNQEHHQTSASTCKPCRIVMRTNEFQHKNVVLLLPQTPDENQQVHNSDGFK